MVTLFLTTLLFVVFTLCYKEAGGGEIYPAVFQPAFADPGEVHGTTTVMRAKVTLTFADGRTEAVEPEALVPTNTNSAYWTFQHLYRNPQWSSTRAARIWLAGFLSARYPGVAYLHIAWTKLTFQAATLTLLSSRPTSSFDIYLSVG